MRYIGARLHPRVIVAVGLLLFLLLLPLLWSAPAQSATSAINLQLVGSAAAFDQPLFLTHAGDGSGRLFIVEKTGRIKIIQNGQVLPEPFLDISGRVGVENESGLLGLAFPPNYANDGYFFIYYSHLDKNLVGPEPTDQGNNDGHDTVVARLRVSANNPNVADPNSEERILIRNQPYANHNGGMMAFGPDGNLYIALGDGGDRYDPQRQAQNLDTLLGKLLRITVSGTGTYTVPAGNPFANTPNAKPEIWDFGLRNPWRLSFDRATGDLLLADVGESVWEEVNVHPAGSGGGLNFGWSCYEASSQFLNFNNGQTCDGPFTFPVLEYGHDEGTSITGGYVYRGAAYADLTGRYFFGDFGNGRIWSMARTGSGWSSKQLELDTNYAISSFGEDEAGELYVVDFNGSVYRLTSDAPPPTSTATATPVTTVTPAPTVTPGGTPLPGTPTATAIPTATPTATARATGQPTLPADADFVLPGTQPGMLVDAIVDPSTCQTCHTEPIYQAWRGSMMSQSGRDPLFWAALHVAEQDVPGSGDYCLRCHVPKGWFEGRSHPSDGTALVAQDFKAGVACEVCHRAVAPAPATSPADQAATHDATVRALLDQTPPTDHFGSAMLILDPEDNRRGPFAFDEPPPHPKATWRTEFLGQGQNPVAEAAMCGTCHNLDNPALSWDAERNQYWPNAEDTPPPSVARDAMFPLERTFEEWLHSDYATAAGVPAPQFAGSKADGIVRTCQDCHMLRTTGAAVYSDGVERDCAANGCLPAHVLAGGNTWVPQLLQDERWQLAALADAEALDATVLAARDMLQKAATLSVDIIPALDGRQAVVRVVNETGHKLPSGYPEGRRMWINLRAYDKDDKLVYVSGAYNGVTGVLLEDPALKVYEVKQGITPELAAELGREAGASFHFVLNNTTVKDNRIPPRGYTAAAYNRPGLAPVGARYADGQYWDTTVYNLPANTVRVIARLYYQTASKEYIDFLRARGGPAGTVLGVLWDDLKSPPELMATADVVLTAGAEGQLIFFPVVIQD